MSHPQGPPPPQYGSQPVAVAHVTSHQPYLHPKSPTSGSTTPASLGFRAGSLGTPHVKAFLRGSPADGRPGSGNWRHTNRKQQSGQSSPPNYQETLAQSQAAKDVILVPTRPLLRSLARECRPSPPWSVGRPVPESATEEILLFFAFLSPTSDEAARNEASRARVAAVFQAEWPDCNMIFAGGNAAGVPVLKDTVTHYCLPTSTVGSAASDIQETRVRLLATANQLGFQADFGTDYRGVQTITLTEAMTGERAAVRFGPGCERIAASAMVLEEQIKAVPARLAVLVTLDALLRQNKLLDETGLNEKLISTEAIAVMLLAIANSYSSDDAPDAGRLLNDFFLTYGFPAHFDCSQNSVSASGMTSPVAKLHREAQLSVLDPAQETANLTSKVDKVAHLLAIFNYCYTASTQYLVVSLEQRRAQSVLSTMIGGETYWSRVLTLYHQRVAPFFDVVNEKKFRLLAPE